MMQKIIKRLAVIVAILLIGGVLFVANAFVGNPLSKMLVTYQANQYIEANYADLNLNKEIGYDFKSNNYFVKLWSNAVEDLHFTLYYSQGGRLQRDLYENNITEGWNVLHRVNEDYREVTEAVFDTLENDIFFDGEHFYGNGHIMSTIECEDRMSGTALEIRGVDGTTLELDKAYDAKLLGKEGGLLDVAVSFADGDVSYERGAQAMQRIKDAFDEAGIGFCAINFGIFNAEGNYAYHIDGFPYDAIESEDIVTKIQIAHETNPNAYDK